MREIKYRIPWHNAWGVFQGFTYWGRIDNKEAFSSDCFTSPGQWGDRRAKPDEQYTGLHDKNGKEIYEGDIYLSTYRAGGAGSIRGRAKERVKHIVEWYDRGRWRGERIEQGRGYGCCHPDCELGEGIEVIGNIHENPELLK